MTAPAPISYETYISAIRNYIKTSNEIISSLESIKSFVNESKKGSNIVKTFGTTSGVAATVATLGLVFAPLTGGLSALATGVAVGGAVGSVGMTIACSIGETIDGKKAVKRIEACQADHEQSVNKLREESGRLMQIVDQLVENGINFDAAIISTFTMLKDIGKSGGTLYSTIEAVNKIKYALQAGHIQKILAPTGISITKNLNGGLSVAFPTVEAVGQMTQAQVKAFGSLSQHGPEILLGKTLTKFGKAVAIVSVFFTLADVISLVHSWTTEHPLVEPIQLFIEQLKASVESCNNQIHALEIF